VLSTYTLPLAASGNIDLQGSAGAANGKVYVESTGTLNFQNDNPVGGVNGAGFTDSTSVGFTLQDNGNVKRNGTGTVTTHTYVNVGTSLTGGFLYMTKGTLDVEGKSNLSAAVTTGAGGGTVEWDTVGTYGSYNSTLQVSGTGLDNAGRVWIDAQVYAKVLGDFTNESGADTVDGRNSVDGDDSAEFYVTGTYDDYGMFDSSSYTTLGSSGGYFDEVVVGGKMTIHGTATWNMHKEGTGGPPIAGDPYQVFFAGSWGATSIYTKGTGWGTWVQHSFGTPPDRTRGDSVTVS
jgi:hypothetical protein